MASVIAVQRAVDGGNVRSAPATAGEGLRPFCVGEDAVPDGISAVVV